MNDGIREIRCEELDRLEQEFPEEISVVREMLAEIDQPCEEHHTA